MTPTIPIIASFACGVLFFAGFATLFLILRESSLARVEHHLRSRAAGAVLMFLALAWCIPQIRAVAWTALAPWLWPLAVAATAAAFFYLDNVLARAVAGVLIMGAYTFLSFSFAHRLPTGIYGAALAWFWGTAGILIAAKPCWLRDFLRLSARRKIWRYAGLAVTALTSLFGILVITLLWG